MGRIATLYNSTLGKKAIVAATGIVLFGFVVMHMAGNLKTFTGNDAEGVPHIDIYAKFLRTMGEPMMPYGSALWVVRIVLLVALVLHVVNVIQLARRNHAARPVAYHHTHVRVEATLAAGTMMVSGLGLLVFIVIHLLQFTTGTIQITPVVHEHVYANLYNAFSRWFVVLFYVLAMGLLAFHLYHGVWSLFQTLGIDNPDRNRGLRVFAALAALVLLVGFCSVPVLILLGVMPDPPPIPAHTEGGP
jgi:succinate dehydrogenase / fumarate reductase cytochrome b subunit